MRVPRREPEKARIEVIPMIDIIFFLLVFFMISTPAWLTHLDSCILHAASWHSKAKRVWQSC
jgi:biopolymer transport protein ExbD